MTEPARRSTDFKRAVESEASRRLGESAISSLQKELEEQRKLMADWIQFRRAMLRELAELHKKMGEHTTTAHKDVSDVLSRVEESIQRLTLIIRQNETEFRFADIPPAERELLPEIFVDYSDRQKAQLAAAQLRLDRRKADDRRHQRLVFLATMVGSFAGAVASAVAVFAFLFGSGVLKHP